MIIFSVACLAGTIHERVIFSRSSAKFNSTIHQSPHGFTNTKARVSLTIEETTVHRISIDWTIDALIIISHELNLICWANCLVRWFCNSYSSLQGLPGQILPQQHWERSQEMTANFFWSVSPLKDDLLYSSLLLETLECTLLRDWLQPFVQENERSTECLSACLFCPLVKDRNVCFSFSMVTLIVLILMTGIVVHGRHVHRTASKDR